MHSFHPDFASSPIFDPSPVFDKRKLTVSSQKREKEETEKNWKRVLSTITHPKFLTQLSELLDLERNLINLIDSRNASHLSKFRGYYTHPLLLDYRVVGSGQAIVGLIWKYFQILFWYQTKEPIKTAEKKPLTSSKNRPSASIRPQSSIISSSIKHCLSDSNQPAGNRPSALCLNKTPIKSRSTSALSKLDSDPITKPFPRPKSTAATNRDSSSSSRFKSEAQISSSSARRPQSSLSIGQSKAESKPSAPRPVSAVARNINNEPNPSIRRSSSVRQSQSARLTTNSNLIQISCSHLGNSFHQTFMSQKSSNLMTHLLTFLSEDAIFQLARTCHVLREVVLNNRLSLLRICEMELGLLCDRLAKIKNEESKDGGEKWLKDFQDFDRDLIRASRFFLTRIRPKSFGDNWLASKLIPFLFETKHPDSHLISSDILYPQLMDICRSLFFGFPLSQRSDKIVVAFVEQRVSALSWVVNVYTVISENRTLRDASSLSSIRARNRGFLDLFLQRVSEFVSKFDEEKKKKAPFSHSSFSASVNDKSYLRRCGVYECFVWASAVVSCIVSLNKQKREAEADGERLLKSNVEVLHLEACSASARRRILKLQKP